MCGCDENYIYNTRGRHWKPLMLNTPHRSTMCLIPFDAYEDLFQKGRWAPEAFQIDELRERFRLPELKMTVVTVGDCIVRNKIDQRCLGRPWILSHSVGWRPKGQPFAQVLQSQGTCTATSKQDFHHREIPFRLRTERMGFEHVKYYPITLWRLVTFCHGSYRQFNSMVYLLY